MTDEIRLTLEGPGDKEEGMPIAALVGVEEALRLMVEHLGDRQPGPGRPPSWAREQSRLRVSAIRPGSVVAELRREAPQTGTGQGYLDDLGLQAFEAVRTWDGSEDSLPERVRARLSAIPRTLPDDTRLWLGNGGDRPRVEITRGDREAKQDGRAQDALLHGWLREVNWAKGTAQLHDYGGGYVALRFESALADDMLRLATKYVEVRGRGRFDKNDEWTSVVVEQVSGTGSWREPFDLEAFLNNPNPKIFDADKVVTIDLTDEEWEAFNSAIREGREA